MKNIKCVVVGDEASGKSDLLIRYCFMEPYPEHFSDYTMNCMVDDEAISLQLYTAGQEYHQKIRPMMYPQTDIFILLFSLVNPATLENVENLWTEEIKLNCPETPYILVGNHSVLRDNLMQQNHTNNNLINESTPISSEYGEMVKNRINASDYIECDAISEYNLREVFLSAIRTAIKNINSKNANENCCHIL